MSYYAIDVETANADYSSICQIGIVHFKDGQIIDKWCTLVNPEAYFDPFNSAIHGITEKDVEDAPTFDEIHIKIIEKITDKITVHHMPFDRIAITRACLKYNLDIIQAKWLDSAKIVRRNWEQYAYSGYGLANIADFLGIEFKHHDALEDAIAAAKVVHLACEQSQRSVEDWLIRTNQPIFTYQGGSSTIKLEGDPEGLLFGENLVFTGALFLPRNEAAKIAANLGCNVSDAVSKKTTILVVGIQDENKLAGYDKSSKHRKAEEFIKKGFPIKILSERDFVELCNSEVENLKLDVPKLETKTKNSVKKRDLDGNRDMSFIVEINENIVGEFNKAWNNLSNEDKLLLHREEQKHKEILNAIKECSHKEKRILAKGFKAVIGKVELLYYQYNIDSFENDDIYLIDIIQMEMDQINDILYDLKQDKITLAEFFDIIYCSINNIESEYEEGPFPQAVNDFCNATLDELKRIREEILEQ